MKHLYFLIITLLFALPLEAVVKKDNPSLNETYRNAQSSVQIDSTEIVSKASSMPLCFDYEEINYLKLSKAELWQNLRAWVSRSFSTRFVIDTEDKEVGRMIVKFTSNTKEDALSGFYFNLNSTLQIDVREGRYRIKLYDNNVEHHLSDKDYSYYSRQILLNIRETLEGVQNADRKYFGGSSKWYLNQYRDNWLQSEVYKNLPTVASLAIFDLNRRNQEVFDSLKAALSERDDF